MKGIAKHRSDITVNPLGGGVERSVLAYDDPLMAVEVSFETGSEGAQKGVLLDVFTPKRDDFLKA